MSMAKLVPQHTPATTIIMARMLPQKYVLFSFPKNSDVFINYFLKDRLLKVTFHFC